MPDLQRVGGVTEFMRVGHMAESYDMPVSGHLFPETSLQMLGALSNADLSRIHALVLADSTMRRSNSRDGHAVVPERPGWGFTFNKTTFRIWSRRRRRSSGEKTKSKTREERHENHTP